MGKPTPTYLAKNESVDQRRRLNFPPRLLSLVPKGKSELPPVSAERV